jgi:hypothetical protein
VSRDDELISTIEPGSFSSPKYFSHGNRKLVVIFVVAAARR